jgi:hypothetical protein
MTVGSLLFLTVLGGCSSGAPRIPELAFPAAELVELGVAGIGLGEDLARAGQAVTGGRSASAGGAGGASTADTPATDPDPDPKEGKGSKFKPVGPKPAGINQVGDKSWTVTRGLADHWMEDPYTLGNARESGSGWQVFSVRTKAAYHLGMRNGDIVIEANGHRLDTKPQLLAAYLDLKNDREFDVTFLRAGAKMHHHYAIVGE